jgi:hypothetical protein
MATVSTGSTTIQFGSNLRIGYRAQGSLSPFTYLLFYPAFNDLPYEFTLEIGDWEVEYTEVCKSCENLKYSTPQVVNISIAS